MAAKGKYTEKNIQKCLDAIAVYGTDKAGYEAIPISAETFYKWLKDPKKPDFPEGVARAREDWYNSQSLGAKRKAWDYLRRSLEEGVIERWQSVEDKPIIGEDGQIDMVQITKSRTVHKGVPEWVISRYLGPVMHELEALNTLVQAGWFPKWIVELSLNEVSQCREAIRKAVTGVLPNRGDSRGAKPGLTDEAAGLIRAKILGVDAESTAAVPGQVDSRSKPHQSSRKIEADRD